MVISTADVATIEAQLRTAEASALVACQASGLLRQPQREAYREARCIN